MKEQQRRRVISGNEGTDEERVITGNEPTDDVEVYQKE
jgi:hypothetical protein